MKEHFPIENSVQVRWFVFCPAVYTLHMYSGSEQVTPSLRAWTNSQQYDDRDTDREQLK